MIELGNIGKIIITKKLKKQINFLHKKIGNTEWSGILIYNHIKGNIKNMNNLVFKTDNLYLMDIGNSGNTNFEYTANSVNSMYDDIPKAIELSTGLIHSHHNMGAFHSPKDMQELKNNSDKYNYYVSLVVDFQETYKCKIGFPSKTEQVNTSYVKNTKGKIVQIKRTIKENNILLGDLEVEIEGDETVNDWFIKRHTKIIEDKKAKNVINSYNNPTEYNILKDYNKDSNFNKYSNRNFNTLIKEKPNKLEKFLKAILTLDDQSTMSLTDAKIYFTDMQGVDRDNYFDVLEAEIEIFHDNIFGVNKIFEIETHIKNVVATLELYPVKHPNISRLIKVLTDFEMFEYE